MPIERQGVAPAKIKLDNVRKSFQNDKIGAGNKLTTNNDNNGAFRSLPPQGTDGTTIWLGYLVSGIGARRQDQRHEGVILDGELHHGLVPREADGHAATGHGNDFAGAEIAVELVQHLVAGSKHGRLL